MTLNKYLLGEFAHMEGIGTVLVSSYSQEHEIQESICPQGDTINKCLTPEQTGARRTLL